jgi:hypothetical protein
MRDQVVMWLKLFEVCFGRLSKPSALTDSKATAAFIHRFFPPFRAEWDVITDHLFHFGQSCTPKPLRLNPSPASSTASCTANE